MSLVNLIDSFKGSRNRFFGSAAWDHDRGNLVGDQGGDKDKDVDIPYRRELTLVRRRDRRR